MMMMMTLLPNDRGQRLKDRPVVYCGRLPTLRLRKAVAS
jgi:hypothetical protein